MFSALINFNLVNAVVGFIGMAGNRSKVRVTGGEEGTGCRNRDPMNIGGVVVGG